MKSCLAITFFLSVPLYLVAMVAPASATNAVRSSIEVQVATDHATQQSQKRIDALSMETRGLLEEYRQTSRELESLRAYNNHLERMVAGQQETLASLQLQLEEVQVTQRDIFPLLGRMIDTLSQFVELDRPFLIEERQQRVERLRNLLDQPDATVAEKYRRVMEAYQIETDYGRTIEAYRGTLQDEGSERTVDFLRVGRMGLFYRSLDGADAGSWDPASQSWQVLPAEHRGALRQAFSIARKQSAPELLTLPLPAPEAAQ